MEPREVATLRDVVDVLEAMYPAATAADWDQVGLVSGDLGQPVRLVHLAVDPTIAVIDEAVAAGADLLVTHHPLLLRGIHSVATTSAKGYAVTRAVRADLALYCAHTNADLATPGVSDALAAACGLTETEPLDLEAGRPLGRVGDLAEPTSLGAFAEALAAALPPTAVGVRVAGRREASVRRVAVLGGSGDDRFEAVRRCRADVYVTADLRHHPASEAREEGRGGPPYLVDAGHYATEWLWLAGAADRLTEALAAGRAADSTVRTYVSTLRTDPWDFLVGANADGGVTC
ncbi:MAG: Nif3-like dinuclear metal center hexameric protein [Dermatophilaceae bacterium]